jgi:hypothetical protein
VTVQQNQTLYYRCTRNSAWRLHDVQLLAAVHGHGRTARVADALLGLAVLLLLGSARSSLASASDNGANRARQHRPDTPISETLRAPPPDVARPSVRSRDPTGF